MRSLLNVAFLALATSKVTTDGLNAAGCTANAKTNPCAENDKCKTYLGKEAAGGMTTDNVGNGVAFGKGKTGDQFLMFMKGKGSLDAACETAKKCTQKPDFNEPKTLCSASGCAEAYEKWIEAETGNTAQVAAKLCKAMADCGKNDEEMEFPAICNKTAQCLASASAAHFVVESAKKMPSYTQMCGAKAACPKSFNMQNKTAVAGACSTSAACVTALAPIAAYHNITIPSCGTAATSTSVCKDLTGEEKTNCDAAVLMAPDCACNKEYGKYAAVGVTAMASDAGCDAKCCKDNNRPYFTCMAKSENWDKCKALDGTPTATSYAGSTTKTLDDACAALTVSSASVLSGSAVLVLLSAMMSLVLA